MKKLISQIDWRLVISAIVRYVATFYAGGQMLN